MSGRLVVPLHDEDGRQVSVVGGKGANLGELTRIDGVRVPAGFCVTTSAFEAAMAAVAGFDDHLARLARLGPGEREAISAASEALRGAIEATAVPQAVASAVIEALTALGDQHAYAVRSSATAEDLPTASFAGQHDTFLNVQGASAIIDATRRCWASLFTERAVTYRLRNGIDHRAIRMAVVVQRLVPAEAAGVVFTADPLTSNRRVTAIEATYGLGEALVAGLAPTDAYRVRDDEIVTRSIVTKPSAVRAVAGGGTEEMAVDPAQQARPVLTDVQVRRLAALARRIEAHYARHAGGSNDCPLDIEWCLAGGELVIVQCRPVTTAFPIPTAADAGDHVYVSVGHQQMMTDAMAPLGLSLWQLVAMRPMQAAGGRLFVDVTNELASPASRDAILGALGASDPLIRDALETVVARPGFLPPPPATPAAIPAGLAPVPLLDADPAIVAELIARNEASVAELQRTIAGQTGSALLDFIRADLDELKRVLTDPQSMQVLLAGMQAAAWLNEHMAAWLGVANAADTLSRSVAGNVTAEMGLALLDVADVIRLHPEVVAVLDEAAEDRVGHRAGSRPHGLLDGLEHLVGGPEARAAIAAFLDRYGMRCVGEIDITRPRWSERPGILLPMILGNVKTFARGESARRFEEGSHEAADTEVALLERLRELPDGAAKAAETKEMIDRVRTFAGYREYPKYGIVRRLQVYKQALMEEAERLVQAGVLRAPEDVFFLTYDELEDAVRTRQVDAALVLRRRDEHRAHQALTPPRVLTSEGEAINGSYRREDVPPGALVGLAVSSGTVEGRARVVHAMEDADLEPGDILVTTHTDPSWSPLFVAVAGLVTEVGGLMTHGAVIAREYGLPAVVGVDRATQRITDGRRIRVDGTNGHVELLP